MHTFSNTINYDYGSTKQSTRTTKWEGEHGTFIGLESWSRDKSVTAIIEFVQLPTGVLMQPWGRHFKPCVQRVTWLHVCGQLNGTRMVYLLYSCALLATALVLGWTRLLTKLLTWSFPHLNTNSTTIKAVTMCDADVLTPPILYSELLAMNVTSADQSLLEYRHSLLGCILRPEGWQTLGPRIRGI